MRRIVIALIAMFSAALLTITTTPAGAQDTTIKGADVAATDDTSARAAITLTINAKIINNTRLKIWGKAARWKNKPVLLQRKTARGGVWKVVERDRTTRRGLYEFSSAPVPNNCQKRYVFRTKVNNRNYRPSPVTRQSYQRCG